MEPLLHTLSGDAILNMAEIAEEPPSSENETTSGISGSTESIDLSCIHWGYLNCTLLNDPKKIKDNVWQTYWVDLCGSTLRLYKDLSLPINAADRLPPASLIGPKNENEKKEAFIILKKGTQVSIVDPGYEPNKSRKRFTVNRRHVFKVSFAARGSNSHAPSYLFQAPSKGSMYRWISKIEEGADMADKPQNESTTAVSVLTSALSYLKGFSFNKRLKEAKLLSMEQRRYQMMPEMRSYLDRDDVDSGMEGDVEEACDNSKKFAQNPHLDIMKKRLQEMEDLVLQLEKEEKAFLGAKDSKLVRRCEFQSTTCKDYCLIPGHPRTLIPKGTELTILGQLSNNRWRCCVELPRKTTSILTNGNHSGTSSEVESISSFDISDEDAFGSTSLNVETFIGSVPNSLLVELSRSSGSKLKYEDGTPIASPGDTPQLSPNPSPPLSPYSAHKNDRDSFPNNKRSSLRRSIASENLSEQDIWEQFCIPSPPSSPVTSRSTSPSLSPSCSAGGSLEALDLEQTAGNEEGYSHGDMGIGKVENESCPEVALRERKETGGRNAVNLRSHREAILMDDNVPETYIGSDSEDEEDDRMVTVIDEVPPHEALEAANFKQEPVKMRAKKEKPQREFDSESLGGLQPNYAFLVTKKLRQRGISLIVGSSSSEDEADDDTGPSKLSLRRLDDEFSRYEEEATGGGVRPYSAFVPMKRASITLSTGTQNFAPRTSTRDELLRDYSSPADKRPVLRANTCTTIEKLGDWSSTENAPPINQRRTLQLSKATSAGFGFTLQTYGIVQQEGQVEYMTFVLTVEEDGPAYMAGLRPGDIILEVDGKNVEEEEHKTIVTLIHSASVSVRLVVVFVDALRRMKMNTRLKLLQAELRDKEREFEELSRKEEDLIKGKGCSTLDLSLLEQTRTRERTGSYLYTTELTSSFAKKSPDVHDSLLQFRQPVRDTKPRPSSMPNQTDLGKQRITATTGSEILQNFSSPDLSAQRRKPISNKLIKSFRKKKPSVESFKSYLDLDVQDQNSEEAGSDNSSSGVFEPVISAPEPTSAASNKVENRNSEREAVATNGWSSCNGTREMNSLSTGEEKSGSTSLRGPSDISSSLNRTQVAPGIAEMRRRLEKSSSAKTLPLNSTRTKENQKGSTLDSKALQRLELQRAGQSPRPESYLLAMDAAGDRPLIPKERLKHNTANGVPYK